MKYSLSTPVVKREPIMKHSLSKKPVTEKITKHSSSRKYNEQPPPANNVPPPANNEFELIKQRAQEVAARLLSGVSPSDNGPPPSYDSSG
jgi:far upstream element-binding protein